MYTVRSQDLDWKPHRVEGVRCALLSVDAAQRMRSMVVKVAVGVTYPLHRHGGIEEIYMLEGDLIIEHETYFAGDYIRSFSGSIHAPSSMTGCMFVIRACMDDEYFSE
jgi:anti-sigma factor ChrR (cupin superfamily)